MKISSLATETKNPSAEERVLAFLEEHPDEVFTYRDESAMRALDMKAPTLSFALWALVKKGRAGKQSAGGRTRIGSREAIRRLRRSLGQEEDPLEAARRNREAIYRRVGYIDTLALLDEVRGGPSF
jgi:hypothetical protein